MTDIAPDGTISRPQSPRPDLLVFEIHGRITKPDVEWMAKASEAAFDRFGTVDMLLIMRPFEGMEAGAIFDGAMLKAQARAVRHVRRYAVVGAPAAARAMIEISDWISPVEAKTFSPADLDAAWTFVGPLTPPDA